MSITKSELIGIFNRQSIALLQDVHTNPELLKTQHPETKQMLELQGNPKAMGTGNKVTGQEVCFAFEAEKHGFKYKPKKSPNPMTPCIMYIYQLMGSQKKWDFGLYAFYQGEIIKKLIIDLKHTNSKEMMLNDGWFEEGVIYVITWNAGTEKYPNTKTFIAFGQNIATKKATEHHDKIRAMRKEMNALVNERIDSYKPYERGADKYSCDQFTHGNTLKNLKTVLATIACADKMVADETYDEAEVYDGAGADDGADDDNIVTISDTPIYESYEIEMTT